jgi:low affinity Fe/Cu permease
MTSPPRPTRPLEDVPDAGRFDRYAERASRFVSQAAFFVISLLGVIVWIPTILVIKSADSWQLVISTIASVLAFLLIALLQNSARRQDLALHRKVDALAAGLITLMHQQLEADPAALEGAIAEVEEAIGLEKRMQGEEGAPGRYEESVPAGGDR